MSRLYSIEYGTSAQVVAKWALVWRNGTWHLPTCLDSKVNSQIQGCSKKCQRSQVAMAWTERLVGGLERPADEQPRQLRLEAS